MLVLIEPEPGPPPPPDRAAIRSIRLLLTAGLAEGIEAATAALALARTHARRTDWEELTSEVLDELNAALATAMIMAVHDDASLEAIRDGDFAWEPLSLRTRNHRATCRPFISDDEGISHDPAMAIVTVVAEDDHHDARRGP